MSQIGMITQDIVSREEVKLREGAHTGHRNWGLADELQLVE